MTSSIIVKTCAYYQTTDTESFAKQYLNIKIDQDKPVLREPNFIFDYTNVDSVRIWPAKTS